MNKPETPYAALNAAADAADKARAAYHSASVVYLAAESACTEAFDTIAHNEAKAAAEAGALSEAATKACAGNCASCRK
jgi:hypothetical protein